MSNGVMKAQLYFYINTYAGQKADIALAHVIRNRQRTPIPRLQSTDEFHEPTELIHIIIK